MKRFIHKFGDNYLLILPTIVYINLAFWPLPVQELFRGRVVFTDIRFWLMAVALTSAVTHIWWKYNDTYHQVSTMVKIVIVIAALALVPFSNTLGTPPPAEEQFFILLVTTLDVVAIYSANNDERRIYCTASADLRRRINNKSYNFTTSDKRNWQMCRTNLRMSAYAGCVCFIPIALFLRGDVRAVLGALVHTLLFVSMQYHARMVLVQESDHIP